MKLIDLSVPITESMPIYPGDPKIVIKVAGNIQTDGFEDHYLSMGTHAGTHIDIPQHMIENGKGLDEFPLETFTGRGICIKIENKQFNLEKIRSTNIQQDDIVFFYTGMSHVFTKPEYFEDYPALSE